jgi:hypothetical protein
MVLENHKLYYEDMEFKKMGKSPSNLKTNKVKQIAKPKSGKTSKVSLKDRVKTNLSKRLAASRSAFNDIKLKFKPNKKPSKLSKKAQLEQKNLTRQEHKRAILGIGLLFVVVSITYSTYVIYNGVSSSASRVMLIPQVVFAILTLAKAFSKIYK